MAPPPTLARHDVEVAGGEGAVEGWLFRATGTPRCVAVVYLPGTGGDRASGNWLAERLVPRGFDVLAIDGPVVGASTDGACTHGPLAWPDVRRALDRVGLQRAILVDGTARAASALQVVAEDRRILGVVVVEDPKAFRIVRGAERGGAGAMDWSAVERWLDEVAPPKGPPAEAKVPGVWAFAGIVPGEPLAPKLLEPFPASALNPAMAVEALNRRWPRPGVVLVRQKEEAVFLRVLDAELLTQGMGTTGALDYMATVVFTLTSLPGVDLVHLDFPEGDHATPGMFMREDFTK